MTKTVLIIIIGGVLVVCGCTVITGLVLLPRFTGDDSSNIVDNNSDQTKTDDTNSVENGDSTNPIVEVAPELPLPSRSSDTCSVLSQAQLPLNWPDDFTLYPGAEITSVKCAPTSADLYEVRVLVTGSVDQITSYFESEVISKDWELDPTIDNDLYDTYSAYTLINAYKEHKDSSRQMILDIRKRSDNQQGSRVEVIYREREW